MSETVKSWCDACQSSYERTGYGCDGHFACSKPEAPEGYRLTGNKERTDAGWREDVEPTIADKLTELRAQRAASGATDDFTEERAARTTHRLTMSRLVSDEAEKAIPGFPGTYHPALRVNDAGGQDIDMSRVVTVEMSESEANDLCARVNDVVRAAGWQNSLATVERVD